MKLRVLVVGKLKNEGLAEVERDYLKRLRSTFPTQVLEFRDGDALRKKAALVRVLMDERGEQLDSPGLAGLLEDLRERGHRDADFLIGDAYGFTDADRSSATRVVALSRMTLPHRLARLLLVEQLYRASTILTNHPYHH